MCPSAFTTVTGDPASPWIRHVPHASTRIPPAVRARILLGDDDLHAELRARTDAHTDRLAARTAAAPACRLRHHGRDARVGSIMLEVRRDAYLHADGTADDAAIDRLTTAAAGPIDRFPGSR